MTARSVQKTARRLGTRKSEAVGTGRAARVKGTSGRPGGSSAIGRALQKVGE